MVITNNDITLKNYKKLSIQLSLDGLSFSVFDMLTHKVLLFEKVTFKKEAVLEEELWKVFIDYPVLKNQYDDIIILHNNHLNTFVPDTLFDENQLGTYLQYNIKVFNTDLFSYDTIENYAIHNVFVPYMNINNFLLDQYESFDFKNINSILVKKILDLSIGNNEKQVFVHFQENYFEIVVVRNQMLLLFNSFEYQTPEDLAYYLLFTYEQLQLSPEVIPVFFLGKIDETSEYFKIAYKFIRNCELLDTSKWVKILGPSESEIREHFILFHS